VTVVLPSVLRSYTGSPRVAARGATLAEVLADLDRQFPGIRFRMVNEQGRTRAHLRFFVNGEAVSDLSQTLREGDEVFIVQALSGG
jgi:molybdopterin converting factor small subunit